MLDATTSALSEDEISSLLQISQRDGDIATTRSLIVEKSRRSRVSSKLLKQLEWQKWSVKEALVPFVTVTQGVVGNKRTVYSEAGGRKIGRRVADPDKLWIDTYTAIKTGSLNATFACQIKRPGDDPVFVTTETNAPSQSFSHNELERALIVWSAIALRAQL